MSPADVGRLLTEPMGLPEQVGIDEAEKMGEFVFVAMVRRGGQQQDDGRSGS